MTTTDSTAYDRAQALHRLCEYSGRTLVTDEAAWKHVAPFVDDVTDEFAEGYDEGDYPHWALQKLVADAAQQSRELPVGESAAMQWRQVVSISTLSARLADAVGVEAGDRGQYIGKGTSADARHEETMKALTEWAGAEDIVSPEALPEP